MNRTVFSLRNLNIITVLQGAAQWKVSFLSIERYVTTVPSVLRSPIRRWTPVPPFPNILRLSTVASKKVEFSSRSDLFEQFIKISWIVREYT